MLFLYADRATHTHRFSEIAFVVDVLKQNIEIERDDEKKLHRNGVSSLRNELYENRYAFGLLSAVGSIPSTGIFYTRFKQCLSVLHLILLLLLVMVVGCVI